MTKQRSAEKKMWRVVDYLRNCEFAAKTLGMPQLAQKIQIVRIAACTFARWRHSLQHSAGGC